MALVVLLLGAGVSSSSQDCTCAATSLHHVHQCCHQAEPPTCHSQSAPCVESFHLCACLHGPTDPTSDIPQRGQFEAPQLWTTAARVTRALNLLVPSATLPLQGLAWLNGHSPPAYLLDCSFLI